MRNRLLLLFSFLCLAAVSFAQADTLKTDTLKLATDTLAADTAKAKGRKKPAESEYQKLIKKGGTVLKGLVTMRHIEDKYYFEVPDSLLGRLLLCVTRYTAVPQGFGKFAGEEIRTAPSTSSSATRRRCSCGSMCSLIWLTARTTSPVRWRRPPSTRW